MIAWPYVIPISRALTFPTHYRVSWVGCSLGKKSHWLINISSPLSYLPIWFPKWSSQATLTDSLRKFPADKWVSFCLSPDLSSCLLRDNIRTSIWQQSQLIHSLQCLAAFDRKNNLRYIYCKTFTNVTKMNANFTPSFFSCYPKLKVKVESDFQMLTLKLWWGK